MVEWSGGEDLTILQLENLLSVHDRAGVRKRIEDRYAASFIITLRGRIRFTGREGAFESDERHAVFLPRGWSYENTCLEEADSYTFNFQTGECDLLPAVLPRPTFAFCEERYQGIRLAQVQPEGQYRVLAELYLLAGALYEKTPQNPKDAWVADALRFFRGTYGDPDLRVEDAARHLHISAVYLYKLFRAQCGRTPHDCLLEIRMQEARRLLWERLPVSAVALAVGYRELPQFSRAYKKYYGHPPTKEL